MDSLSLNGVEAFRANATLDGHVATVNGISMTLVFLPESKK